MPASAAVQPDPVASPARILIIDDDEIILEMLRIYLEDGIAGVEVSKYEAGSLGRPDAGFEWQRYDLLLLDYRLGRGESGIEWLDAYAHLPGFPQTLLLTASDDPLVVGAAVASGAGGYLNKSRLTPDSLVETVTQMLGAAGAEHRPPAATPVPAPAPAPEPAHHEGRSLDTGPGGVSYRFTRQIGRGATSRVYLAERARDGVTVVLKILDHQFAADPAHVNRFVREGELLSQVDSPYVVKIHDHGATNSYGYIAMEFFGRGDLAQRMACGVQPDDALLYLEHIAYGLAAVHERGIVHRDLKPANVMFRGDGSMALVDFGLSKRPGVDTTLTATGEILGTPYCMSPEQTEGREADARSDLYAAGVIFYQMLTGRRPFVAANLPALLLAIQNEPAPPLPPDLACYQPLVDRLLAKRPEDRFRSAWELVVALRQLQPAA